MGVTDWQHIQVTLPANTLILLGMHEPIYISLQHIAGAVRKELGLEEPYWNRSITLPRWSELGMFLETKSFTGRRADKLKFEQSTK